MENGSLMKVESIVECSPLQYFWTVLSDNRYWNQFFVLFLSGRLCQVLLYIHYFTSRCYDLNNIRVLQSELYNAAITSKPLMRKSQQKSAFLVCWNV